MTEERNTSVATHNPTRRTIAVGAALLLAWAAQPARAQIQWRAGPSTLSGKSQADVVNTIASTGLRGAGRRLVVQFDSPMTPAVRAQLEQAGVRLLSPLGDNAFFASVQQAAVDTIALSAIKPLKDAQTIQREWKLDPRIPAGKVPSWAIVAEEPAGKTTVALYVLFHGDVPLFPDAEETVKRHGGTVRDELESINGLVLEIAESSVEALADEDAVQWIEWPLPPMSGVNNSNRARTQADTVQATPYNLDGSGVTVLVYDGGTVRATHQDFGGRLTVHDSTLMHYHPTHVAGTIGGDGSASGGTYKGMAPAVTMLSYGFEDDGSGIFLYSNPGDIEDDYDEAINIYGADISNNSIGTNTCANGFDCEITGDYGATAALIDAIVRGSLGDPFRIIWANGNERGDDDYYCPGCGCTRCEAAGVHTSEGYHSTAPPACAKNHITVGALNSNDDSMTSFSSWGPTDDGRIKPDISAPGCQSNDDYGVTSTFDTSDTAYNTICGTSMASPTVCGLSALLIEDFQAQFPTQPLLRNSTLKVLLAHTAVDLGNTGPDYQSGYGSVRIQDAIDLMRGGAFVEASVSQGGTYSRQVVVQPGDPELKVTLAWDDVPGTPNVNPSLVNDLDLRVYSPSMARAYPWTLNPASPASAAVQTQEDHVNNIEQVLVNSPAAGTWTIEVYGNNVPQGPQTFSLAGDGAVNAGLWITYPAGRPDIVAPSTPVSFNVDVVTSGETYVPGSGTLHYRYDGGTWLTTPLVSLGGTLFRADLPAAACGDTPEYYVSAQGTISGVVTEPSDAPTTTYTHPVGEYVVVLMEDDFEAAGGWTVDPGASTGNWERADPQEVTIDPPLTITQPEDDHTPGGTLCYVTQAAAGSGAGSYDVDGGPSHLISPTIDLSDGDAIIGYWRWYHISTAWDDSLVVAVSNNDGGSWHMAETVSDRETWHYAEWRVSDFVTPTAQVKVRFTVHDSGSGSLIESLIDDFIVTGLQCEEACTSGCLIDDVCYDDSQINPANDCQICDHAADPADWSLRPNGTTCDDGLYCNVGETCTDGTCGGGSTRDCGDDVDCTDDSCNDVTDACENVLNDAHCPDDGQYCNGTETCDAELDCVSSGDPCDGTPGTWCHEVADDCEPYGDGDFDDDGDVDLEDFAAFQTCFDESATQAGCEPGNMTGPDDIVDLDDFTLFAAELESGTGGPQ